MDETFEDVISTVKNMMTIAKDSKQFDCFFSEDTDENSFEAATGRSSSNAGAVGVPLSEAEPNMFPCLVIICGSAFAFLKVSSSGFGFSVR